MGKTIKECKTKRKRWRVYNVENTPFMGGDDYFDMISLEMAMKLRNYLEKIDKKRIWVISGG